MDTAEFAHVVVVHKSFDEAVVAVLKAVEQKGWALFAVYDVRERLAVKGFNQKPLKIIEVCSAKHAARFLSKNRLISLCMPCKINVLEEDGAIKIAGMKPSIISQFFSEVSAEEAQEVERELIEIVDAAVA
ncbi:MAG: DUF302 domain-containing protein [Patescibacteria group bacterium]|nr:DUF302 domain-containing protein [Patescibacteria group bacterium]